MLDMGPIRPDGSDKFFGMENVRELLLVSPPVGTTIVLTREARICAHTDTVWKHLLLQLHLAMSLLLGTLP